MNVTFCLLTAPDGFGIGRFIKSTTGSEIVSRFMPGMRHIYLMNWKLYMIYEAGTVFSKGCGDFVGNVLIQLALIGRAKDPPEI